MIDDDDLAEGDAGGKDGPATIDTPAAAAPAAAPPQGQHTEQRSSASAQARDKGADVATPATIAGARDVGAVTVPGENATPDEVAAFHRALGVPATAAEYKIEAGDGYQIDAAAESTFRQLAHESGLTPAQVERLVVFDRESAQRSAAAEKEAAVTRHAEAITTLTKEWGGTEPFQQAVKVANEAWATIAPYFGDGAKAVLQTRLASGALLGSDPGFIRLMVAIGRGELGHKPLAGAEIDALRAKVATPEYSDRDAARLAALLSPNGNAAPPPAPGADVERQITELRTLIGSDAYGDAEAAKLARLLEQRGAR